MNHSGVEVDWTATPKFVLPVVKGHTPLPPVDERVVPSHVRLEPMTTDFTAPVPLPARIPPSVVEPVPPFETESALASVSMPWMSWFPVVVAPPEIVSPEVCVPPPIVEDALTKMPTVVVGASAPFTNSNVLPNAVEPGSA